ncbi:hypothetical protein SUGI_0429040 [Cryptomeria japonica]|uniref:probable inorganic phosphate transporter 1-3 n=1 Tax=Cryptomeria japonica TaxID=3369 RepID=UPI002408A04F|nr:probable inorganic phosphate transporter 1-3 [Cryptomeria japonica]GLJ22776.1 hypothetical protein SUGI_0429040 [Cryptomeria japonica]
MAKPQLEVFSALDKAKTQWYHFKAIVISGMGFFTDAYDLFCICTVTKLLGRLYYYDPASGNPGSLPPNVAAAVNSVALCGTLVGQLFFGWLGDKMGRKRIYGITLMFMVVSTIGSSLSYGHTAKSVMTTLCFFRFWLGISIGGDYPLSATIMSEYANQRTRGAFMAAVFAMQGFGIIAGGAVAIMVSACFNHAYKRPVFAENPSLSTAPQADFVWRIILMVGAVPAVLTYYWRMRMPETARFTVLVARNAKQAASDMSKVLQMEIDEDPQAFEDDDSVNYGLFSTEFLVRHGRHLLGTTFSWFFLDIAFYSQNLFQKDIFTAIGWLPSGKNMNAIEEVYRIARAQSLIVLCSALPGFWFTVLLIDRIGRIPIQLMGFFFMTVFMLAISIPYEHWRGHKCGDDFCGGNNMAFVVLYSFTVFFSNFGPNSTTFIVPAEIFPAHLRSTCHGISAAAGKAGAIVGAFGFLYAAQSPLDQETNAGYPRGIGIRTALLVLAGMNALGFVCTFLVPETNGKSLEELSGEIDEDAVGYKEKH